MLRATLIRVERNDGLALVTACLWGTIHFRVRLNGLVEPLTDARDLFPDSLAFCDGDCPCTEPESTTISLEGEAERDLRSRARTLSPAPS